MAPLGWIDASERLVGKDGPYSDTLNRALRELLTQSGYDPDALTFPGIAGPAYNILAYAAPTDGVSDSSTALLAAAAAAGTSKKITIPAGTYAVAASLTLGCGVVFEPGAILKPAAGVNLTFGGSVSAGLHQIFDTTPGGHILFTKGRIHAIFPEWYGARASAAAAVNTPAIQAAILSSLSLTSLSLAVQAGASVAPVEFHDIYPVTTLYAPRFTALKGIMRTGRGGNSYGISSTTNAPILVLGRVAVEDAFLDVSLTDFVVQGSANPAHTAQVGVKCGLTGVNGFTYGLHWRSVTITGTGSHGVEVTGANESSMMVNTFWDNVRIYNVFGNVVHISTGPLNAFNCTNCEFTDSANGWLVEDANPAAQSASETVNFQSSSFEALGFAPGAADFSVGSYGFKSTKYYGHYSFKSCYIEGNGNKAGDTTGCHIYVRSAWQLSIEDSLLASSNVLVWMAYGGTAKIEGTYINGGTNSYTCFLLDNVAPTGTNYTNLDLGKNRWAAAYTGTALSRVINASVTTITGYKDYTSGARTFDSPLELATWPKESTSNLTDIPVANGATSSGLTISYGFVQIIERGASGDVALVAIANGVASIVWQTAAANYATTDIAGKYCLLMTAGVLTIKNRIGSAAIFRTIASRQG